MMLAGIMIAINAVMAIGAELEAGGCPEVSDDVMA